MLANMTLDGLEEAIRCAVPRRSRVNFIRYADDFIVKGKSKRLLEEAVKPAVEAFLVERGLRLSEEKTVITHIKQGFTFLGQTFCKHGKGTAHHAIEGGSPRPLAKSGCVNQQTRQRPDVYHD